MAIQKEQKKKPLLVHREIVCRVCDGLGYIVRTGPGVPAKKAVCPWCNGKKTVVIRQINAGTW